MSLELCGKEKDWNQSKKYIKENFDPELIRNKYHNFYKKEMEIKS